MKKWFVILCMIFASMGWYANVHATTLFSNNFDSYAVGTLLNTSPGGWVQRYAGSGAANQKITNTQNVSSPNCLQLSGSYCFAAAGYHAVTNLSSATTASVEASVKVDHIATGGCGPQLASVSFFSTATNASYGVVSFERDGNIYAMRKSTDGNDKVLLGSYSINQWYLVRVEMDTVSRTFDVYINNTLMLGNIYIVDTGNPTGIQLTCTHNYSPTNPIAFFDDVAVKSGENTARADMLYDNFEAYTANTFPTTQAPGNWKLQYAGAGSNQQIVVDNQNYPQGSGKALKLVGSTCYAATAYHPVTNLPNTPQASVETAVKVDHIATGGCGPQLASVEFYNPSIGQWGTGYGQVSFENDGNVYAIQSHYQGTKTQIMSNYSTGQWYRVRTEVDFVARTFSLFINDELKMANISFSDSGMGLSLNPNFLKS